MLLFTLMLFLPDTAYAAEDTGAVVEKALLAAAVLMIKLLNMALWPILLMLGDLMNNDLIIGPGMEERLLSIWQQVRNLVNIAFVLVLLVMAFYNVSGYAKEGNFALKTGLPKLIIGLILVNFTFLGGKIVLDISNIATNAVFALPEITQSDDDNADAFDFAETQKELGTNLCTKEGGATITSDDIEKDPDAYVVAGWFCEKDDTSGNYIGTLDDAVASRFFSKLSSSNVGLIIAINMGKLTGFKYSDINITTIGDLAVNTMFSVIMFVVYAISYIVLAMLLVSRIAVLWVALAFSPVAVLFYVVPELKASAGGAGDASEQVIKHLLAPIKLGIVLTVGYMMMDAMYGAIGSNIDSLVSKTTVNNLSGSLLITGIADLQRLLIAIMSVMIVWKGIFWAADGTLAKGMADKLQGMTESAGSAILGSVKYAPLGPVLGDDRKSKMPGFSWNNLSGMATMAQQGFTDMENRQTREMFTNSAFGKLFAEPIDYTNLASHMPNATLDQIKSVIETGKSYKDPSITTAEKTQQKASLEAAITRFGGADITTLMAKLTAAKDDPAKMIALQKEVYGSKYAKLGISDEVFDKGGKPAAPKAPVAGSDTTTTGTSTETPKPKLNNLTISNDVRKAFSPETTANLAALKIPSAITEIENPSGKSLDHVLGKLKKTHIDAYMTAHPDATKLNLDDLTLNVGPAPTPAPVVPTPPPTTPPPAPVPPTAPTPPATPPTGPTGGPP